MRSSTKLILGFLFAISTSVVNSSIGGYITPSDKKKFLQILQKSFKVEGGDVSSLYYGSQGFKLLNEPYDKVQARESCTLVKNHLKSIDNLEATFNAVSTWSLLGCEGKLLTDAMIKDVKSVLENEKSTTANLRYAAEILSSLKVALPNPAKVVPLLQNQLKEDDSLSSQGHALHAASLLGNSGKFAQDRIEDVVVQADEVDGRLLQWEGGLSTTSLLITGLLRLPGASPFTPAQTDNLANYLLTRTTVQTAKGVVALLEAAQALASSQFPPVCISVLGPSYVSVDKPELKVQVSNIFGQPLSSAPKSLIAQLLKGINEDTAEVVKSVPIKPGSQPVEFSLSFAGLEPRHYGILANVDGHIAKFQARVLGPITINNLEIGLNDADGTSVPKLSKLAHPAKLSTKLQADSSQQLIVKFSISRPVHQAFIRLFTDKREIIFVAEQDSSKIYKVEINLANEIGKSGVFDIELMLGDAIITNPIRWALGTIDVSLGTDAPAETPKLVRGPKPEIRHLFRVAEKRPPETVSLFFTALTAAPFLVLLILWAKIGVNFGNFTSVALPFHAGLGAILGLFTLFWLKLDMFSTCAWLIPVGGFTFLSGHKLLSHIASVRVKKQEKADK